MTSGLNRVQGFGQFFLAGKFLGVGIGHIFQRCGLHRTPRQRVTTYDDAPKERVERSFQAAPLEDVAYTHAREYARKKDLTEPLNPV